MLYVVICIGNCSCCNVALMFQQLRRRWSCLLTKLPNSALSCLPCSALHLQALQPLYWPFWLLLCSLSSHVIMHLFLFQPSPLCSLLTAYYVSFTLGTLYLTQAQSPSSLCLQPCFSYCLASILATAKVPTKALLMFYVPVDITRYGIDLRSTRATSVW